MRSLSRGARAAPFVACALALYFVIHTAQADGMPAPSLPGGWSAAPSRDVQVVKAARFAVAEQTRQTQMPVKLLAIKHVRQQVVAGMNYSMNLLVQSEGQRRLVIAVVWAKPDGSMELTRWHWV
ncbi:MAG: hypothetical protein HXX19_06750 [Rhodoferax sp.]|nr:hypothetical protein [Rhodoferax sp.]